MFLQICQTFVLTDDLLKRELLALHEITGQALYDVPRETDILVSPQSNSSFSHDLLSPVESEPMSSGPLTVTLRAATFNLYLLSRQNKKDKAKIPEEKKVQRVKWFQFDRLSTVRPDESSVKTIQAI